jgi:hypothetical protein
MAGYGQDRMKDQAKHSFMADGQAERMGADMAIQFLLMTLFQIVSEMADDARGFRSDVHKELACLVATYKLPAMPEETEQKTRSAARRVLDSILMRSFDQTSPSKAP